MSSCIRRGEVDLKRATISGALPMSGDPTPRPFLQTSANEQDARFSPDGRWVAFTSDESGREEVYVVPFPGPGGRSLISTEGGYESTMATGRQGDLLPQARHSDGRRRRRAGFGVSGGNRGPTLRGELPNGKLSGLRPRVGLRRRRRRSTFPDQRRGRSRARTNAHYDCDELDIPPSGGPLRHMSAQHLSDLARSPEPG